MFLFYFRSAYPFDSITELHNSLLIIGIIMYIQINKEGWAYLAGKEYSADQYKQFLGQLYDHVDRFGRIPSTRVLSRQLRILKSTAHKVIKIDEGSHMLDDKRRQSFVNTQKQCDYGSLESPKWRTTNIFIGTLSKGWEYVFTWISTLLIRKIWYACIHIHNKPMVFVPVSISIFGY